MCYCTLRQIYHACVLITIIVDMRHLIIILISVVMMDSTDGQYPNCVSCSDGEYIPLCYVAIRS